MLFLINGKAQLGPPEFQYFVVEAEDLVAADSLSKDFVNQYFFQKLQDKLEGVPLEQIPYFGRIVALWAFNSEHPLWNDYQDPEKSSQFIKINF